MPDPSVIWGLAGIVLGFTLGEVSSVVRYRRRIRHLRQALRAECQSIVNQIPQFIDILHQCIASLSEERILPGPAVRAVSTVYKSTIPELTPHLTALERNLLHVAYDRLRVGDETLATYASDCLTALRENLVDNPWGVYIHRMRDLLESYDVTTRLLQSYINGQPIDVFSLTAQAN